MKYYKNSELVQIFNVSDKAIRNWIIRAQSGKNSLRVIEHNGRTFIADSPQNNSIIKRLANEGKKYRNKRSFRSITPTKQLYKNYSQLQIVDMLNSIEKYHELPSHYRYFNEGSSLWDAYLNKLYSADTQNLMNTTAKLIALDRLYLETVLEDYDKVNIIDLGVGNGKGAFGLLSHLKEISKLNKYVGIDCSKELLQITRINLAKLLPDLKIETYVRDISREQFADIATNSILSEETKTANIFLFLGGTLGNFRTPDQVLSIIRESMGKSDILITSDELDSENARNFHGFDIHVAADRDVITRNTRLLDLLSIEHQLYEIEQFFDEKESCRINQIKFKSEIELKVKIGNYYKTLSLRKGDRLVLFRMWEWTGPQLEAMYEKAGFSQIRSTKLHDPEYILMVSKVATS